ncbi:MAG: ATPase [Conexibacter sp.]|nr:ATPase [Conexibacter sp.]
MAGSLWTTPVQWTGVARLRERLPVSSTLAERLAARDAQRFVGRERELAFFDSLFVEDPPAQVVLVHGPGGIGKSTLLREVARRATRRGWSPRIVEGRDLAPVPGEIETALGDLTNALQPLILFDTYERMSAADGWLRSRLLPSLPARAVVILAGRTAPEPGWFEGGWERLSVELKLEPMPADAALSLVRAHGLADGELAQQLILWADGSPLALALAADAAQRDGGSWAPERIHEHPNLVQAILHRVARTELDGGNLDVAAVAAIARACDEPMLRDVLPEVDPKAAYAWLRERTFSEPVAGGVALHEIVRQAMRSDLRTRDPERDRELRRRIADHLFLRGLRAGPRTVVDLSELVENPAVRWGFGADGSTTHRPDLWRLEDAPVAREKILAKTEGDGRWWAATERILEEAPDRVVTVRDARDALCGMAIAVTPENAPPAAQEDLCLGPWLSHARDAHAGDEVLIWRDSIDFVAHGDLSSPVLSILNTAAILRSGLNNPRWSYIPIDPSNEAAVAFARAVNTTHLEHLDVDLGEKVVQCHQIDHSDDGMLGALRGAVYGELGLGAPGPIKLGGDAGPLAQVAEDEPVTLETVRDALRSLHQPMELAASPLASGTTTEERAESVRAEVADAVASAFGDSPDEQLLRRIVQRGYLDPGGSHELAADELHVSRATYFRRLRVASQRVADYLIAKHA